MGELPAFLQSLMLQDVGLQILRIGIHRAELVNTDHISMVSDPIQFDQRAIGRVIIPNGFPELLSEDEILTLMEALVHDFESSPVHPAQQFHAAVAPVLSFGDPHIEPTGDLHPGTHPVPAIVYQIQHLAENTRMRPQNDFLLQARSARMAPQIPAIHHILVRFVQEGIEMTDVGQSQLVDYQARMVVFKGIQGIAVVGVDNEGTLIEFIVMLVQPGHDFIQAHALRSRMDPVQVPIGNHLILQFRPGIHARFGIVLRNELFLMLELDPGLTRVEKTHRR